MSSILPPVPGNIAAGTAPQLIGTLFNWGLYGVLSVQVYIYYLNFPEDKLTSKSLVYGTFIFETVQTGLSTADIYFWFASGYGNMVHLGDVYVSPWDTPFLCGIIAAVVQVFFAYRIWTLRRSYWWLSVLIILTTLVQTAGAFATAIRGHILHHYSEFHNNVLFPSSFHLWLLGDTVSDILIAGSMLYIFYKSKKEKYQLATKILARLVRLIIETNTLTASMALLSFILYAGFPDNNYFICTTLIMGKLYSNTLLVTFNNRIALRKIVVDGAPPHAPGLTGNSIPTLKAQGSTTVESTLQGSVYHTYHIGTNEFRDTRSQDAETIEIKVLKNVEKYDGSSPVGSPTAI